MSDLDEERFRAWWRVRIAEGRGAYNMGPGVAEVHACRKCLFVMVHPKAEGVVCGRCGRATYGPRLSAAPSRRAQLRARYLERMWRLPTYETFTPDGLDGWNE